MARLVWDQQGQKKYQAGVSEGVLFMGAPTGASNIPGIPWNGLTKVSQDPDGGDVNSQYADNIKYVSLVGEESTKGTIEAYTYPLEFERCLGHGGLISKGTDGKLVYHQNGPLVTQQNKEHFSFAYVTKLGNDEKGLEYSETLHIIYDNIASPSQKEHETIGDNPEPITLSVEYNSTPVSVDMSKITWGKTITKENNKFKPCSVLEITREGTPEEVAFYDKVKAMVQGDESTESHLPMPDEIFNAYIAAVDPAA